MLEVELWASVISSENLAVVEHYGTHLMRMVELSSFVLVNQERQEPALYIFRVERCSTLFVNFLLVRNNRKLSEMHGWIRVARIVFRGLLLQA